AGSSPAESMTKARSPVSRVTVGPGVDRSPYELEAVVSPAKTNAAAGFRAEIELMPSTTKYWPASVALATAVSMRLSRMKRLYCEAVKTVPGTAVIGEDQAIRSSPCPDRSAVLRWASLLLQEPGLVSGLESARTAPRLLFEPAPTPLRPAALRPRLGPATSGLRFGSSSPARTRPRTGCKPKWSHGLPWTLQT